MAEDTIGSLLERARTAREMGLALLAYLDMPGDSGLLALADVADVGGTLYAIPEGDRAAAALASVLRDGDDPALFDAAAVAGLVGPDVALDDLHGRGAAVFAVRDYEGVSILADQTFPYATAHEGGAALEAFRAAVGSKGRLYGTWPSARRRLGIVLAADPGAGRWVAAGDDAEKALRDLGRRGGASYFGGRTSKGVLLAAGQGGPPAGGRAATDAEVVAAFDRLVRSKARGGKSVHRYGHFAG